MNSPKTTMKLRITCLLFIISVHSPCLADVFILKDGTKLEGKILKEDADSYLVEINISESIKDERLVKKAELLNIEREAPDLAAFKKIEGLYPAPDLLTVPEYEEHIAAVEEFLKKFPYGVKSNQAKEMLKTLNEESNKIADGGYKLEGEICTVEEYRANAYEMDARIASVKIRQLANAGNWLAALRALEAFEVDFSGSEIHKALLPLMRQVITAHLDQAAALLDSFDKREKARTAGLERMTLGDRANSQRALAEEAAFLETRYQNEKTAKFRWPTTHPFHKDSLADTIRLAEVEMRRLQTSPARTTDGANAFRNAWNAVHSGDPETKTEAMNIARAALLPPRYIQMLEAAIAASGK